LAADQIRRADVLETRIGQGLCFQFGPIVILNSARFQPGIRVGFVARGQMIIFEQRKTRKCAASIATAQPVRA
jgi:hypothetical protein